MTVLSRSFPPLVRSDCRLLILGSLPGTASLAAGRYYAHPHNLFWRLLGAVLDTDLEAQPYEARLETLMTAGVGLWDVVGSAHRAGSLDSAIRHAERNDLATLVTGLPSLRAVAFNGASAFRLGRRVLAPGQVPLVALPSSSPANARLGFVKKQACWQMLRAHLRRE